MSKRWVPPFSSCKQQTPNASRMGLCVQQPTSAFAQGASHTFFVTGVRTQKHTQTLCYSGFQNTMISSSLVGDDTRKCLMHHQMHAFVQNVNKTEACSVDTDAATKSSFSKVLLTGKIFQSIPNVNNDPRKLPTRKLNLASLSTKGLCMSFGSSARSMSCNVTSLFDRISLWLSDVLCGNSS